MRKWNICVLVVVLILFLGGCQATEDDVSITDTESLNLTTIETDPPVITLESIEYWEIVEAEIISMLNRHNLYVSAISHAYPCVQFYVEPGIVIGEKTVALGLSQEEYKEVFESVKVELHLILDKYKLEKPKTAFHGCHSLLDIFFSNWIVNENKVVDNVYSKDVACYGLDLLEYYYEVDENSFVKKDSFHTDVWLKYPVYIP